MSKITLMLVSEGSAGSPKNAREYLQRTAARLLAASAGNEPIAQFLMTVASQCRDDATIATEGIVTVAATMLSVGLDLLNGEIGPAEVEERALALAKQIQGDTVH